MYESRIATDHLTVATIEGFPPEIDALAECNLSSHGFLRAAWYAARAPECGRTLLLRRGNPEGGSDVIAAIPTIGFGPVIGRARKVPGSYWPLRSPLIAPGCNAFEIAQLLEHSAARGLGPVWRVGPARADDPTVRILTEAAQIANWTVLARPAGTAWVIDLEATRAAGFPRKSVAKSLRAGWRRLESLGTPHWRYVRGAAWNDSVLADLARIEADSWIARTTDGSGAKFMNAKSRAYWQHVLADPALAERISATFLMLDDRPVAFSFDLEDGPVQYSIAGSYAEDLGRCNIGKLVNYRVLEDACNRGLRTLDMGAGDTGYKKEMGATEGYEMIDLLFVRSRTAALMLAAAWGPEVAPALPEKLRTYG